MSSIKDHLFILTSCGNSFQFPVDKFLPAGADTKSGAVRKILIRPRRRLGAKIQDAVRIRQASGNSLAEREVPGEAFLRWLHFRIPPPDVVTSAAIKCAFC
jgi:hypothetical protein